MSGRSHAGHRQMGPCRRLSSLRSSSQRLGHPRPEIAIAQCRSTAVERTVNIVSPWLQEYTPSHARAAGGTTDWPRRLSSKKISPRHERNRALFFRPVSTKTYKQRPTTPTSTSQPSAGPGSAVILFSGAAGLFVFNKRHNESQIALTEQEQRQPAFCQHHPRVS